MKKTIILLLILISFLIGFYFNKLANQKKINQAIEKKQRLEKENQVLQKEKVKINQESTELTLNKNKTLEKIVPSTVFFTYKTFYLTNNQYRIDIYLNGQTDGSADVADLVLNLSDNLTVVKIDQGTVFASYPRSLVDKNIITITGMTVVKNNNFQFGKLNILFVSLTLEKKPIAASTKTTVRLNHENSKVFLLGKSILDYQHSFSEINL